MASTAREHEGYLFLSLLQARAGGSMMRRVPEGDVGNLLEGSGPELAREMGLGEKASRALAEVRKNFDAGEVVERLARKGFRVVTYADGPTPHISGSRRTLRPRCTSGGSSSREPLWRSSGRAGRRGRGSRRPGSSGGRSP